MSHTKGPWLRDGNLVYALNERGTNSFTAHFEGENQEGNAALCHAAPDLLDALKMAQLWLDWDGRYDMQGINAAIAKAAQS